MAGFADIKTQAAQQQKVEEMLFKGLECHFEIQL